MFNEYLLKVIDGKDLYEEEMEYCMKDMMEGKIDENRMASFLTALKIKGESVSELTGGAKVLREKATPIEEISLETLDTCGTGGDGLKTYNISTAVSIICATAGLKVVKHGNRSVSSQSGSADVLEALGVDINLSPKQASECLKGTGFCFLFAPNYHSAIKNVMPVRRSLKFRTIFNILGPLANPAKASNQLLGVYHESLTEQMAAVLKSLKINRALVVYGLDGLDELSISAPTKVTELNDGEIRTYYINPEMMGLKIGSLEEIVGGNGSQNAKIIREIFDGKEGSVRDILLLNAGAALYVGGKVKSIKEGVNLTSQLIDNGLVKQKLDQIINYTKEVG